MLNESSESNESNESNERVSAQGQLGAMHRDDEGTPLLRGRAAAGELHLRGAATLQQLAPDEGRQDGGITRLVPPGQSSLLSRTTSRPLMLAVAAVCAAALLLAIGLMSTSERAVTPPQGGGTSLTASAPRQTSGTARDPGERKYRDGRDERGGSKVAGGGWRSQADRSPGMMCRHNTYCVVCMISIVFV